MGLLLTYLIVVGAWDKPPAPLPGLYLARGLPSHAQCTWAVAENWRWWPAVEDCQRQWGAGWAPAWWFDYLERGHCWEHARRATDPLLRWGLRRQSLLDLAEHAGWRVVVTGELRPPVPLSWYREVP